MVRLENLALAIADMNGAFTPGTLAFRIKNPGLLKTHRPEKRQDSDNNRVFSSVMGGFKALTADLQAKSTGQNHRLSPDNTLRDILALLGIKGEPAVHKIVLFLRRANDDESVTGNTTLSWFLVKDAVTDTEEK